MQSVRTAVRFWGRRQPLVEMTSTSLAASATDGLTLPGTDVAVTVAGARASKAAMATIRETSRMRALGMSGRSLRADTVLAVPQRRRVDDFEVRAGQLLEAMQVVAVPARVGCPGDVRRRAVVGQQHAVLLERGEDHPRLRAKPADVDGGFQSKPQAHRRERGAGIVAGLVAGRVDVRRPSERGGEAKRVVDEAGGNLVVAR